jgi:hypothetical protein
LNSEQAERGAKIGKVDNYSFEILNNNKMNEIDN